MIFGIKQVGKTWWKRLEGGVEEDTKSLDGVSECKIRMFLGFMTLISIDSVMTLLLYLRKTVAGTWLG